MNYDSVQQNICVFLGYRFRQNGYFQRQQTQEMFVETDYAPRIYFKLYFLIVLYVLWNIFTFPVQT